MFSNVEMFFLDKVLLKNHPKFTQNSFNQFSFHFLSFHPKITQNSFNQFCFHFLSFHPKITQAQTKASAKKTAKPGPAAAKAPPLNNCNPSISRFNFNIYIYICVFAVIAP